MALVIGVPLAWVLARVRFPGRSLLRALVTLPLVLPPVVGGVALFLALGRRGLVGQYLDRWFGLTIPFTPFAVVLAETFVAMPFLIVTVEGALRAADTRYEEASATLGASRWTTFRRVTLPMIGPSVLAGSVLCWARALGEFGATITFAGNFPGRTQTMPIAVYIALETDPDAAIALSLVLLVVSVVILVSPAGAGAERGDRLVSLDAHLVVRRGQFTVDVELSVPDGEVLGMLGPNGAGKTTALRALAGLEPLTDGHITPRTGWTSPPPPPEERDVGVVFQDYLLFPHLTALDNVAYGLRARGMRKAAARADAADWLDRVGLTDHAGHRPRQLSGGQAQRVALARALARPAPAAAAGRAAGRAGRRHPAGAAHRPAPAPRLVRRAGGRGHPRPGRGDGAHRPAGGARGRPDRPEWTAGRDRPAPAHRLRGPAARAQPLPRRRPGRPGRPHGRRRADARRARDRRGARGGAAVRGRAAPGPARALQPAQRLGRPDRRASRRSATGSGSR